MVMADLSVNICGVDFKNPVIPASGVFGYGREYEELFPLSLLGGISTKGTTITKRLGNPAPRIAETPSGMLNSVGLQNPGIDYFIENELPNLLTKDTVIIANIAGSTMEECVEIAKKLEDTDVHMIELNISCPNVKEGGAAFGTSCLSANAITKAVRKATTKPLIVKLSPNVTSITEIAKSVEEAGADSISLINTLLGMKIDINSRRPILKNNVGGMSGPAVFPIAVRMVWQTANAVSIPIIGMGGISSGEDAIEMMMAGASAVQVGAAIFNDPLAPVHIINEMNEWLDKNRILDIKEIIGSVKPW
jgi:dihydroorotate dehydrogenase (NAD+) catalytic subunit